MKSFKKFMVIILALCMVLPTGCGKNEKAANEGEQYFYSTTIKKINFDASEYVSGGIKRTENGLEYIVSTYEDMGNDEYKMEYKLVSSSLDLSDKKEILLSEIANDNEGVVSFGKTDDEYVFVASSFDEKTYEEHYRIVNCDKDLKVKNSFSLDEAKNEMNAQYIQNFLFASDGNLYIVGDAGVGVVDKDGKLKKVFDTSGWANSIFEGPNGEIYVSGYFGDGEETCALDMASGKLGDALEGFPSEVNYCFFAKDQKAYIFGSNSVMVYDVSAKTTEKLFDWLDVDMYNVYPTAGWANDDGTFTIITSNYDTELFALDMTTFKREEMTAENYREVLTLGCLYANENIKMAAKNFNNSNGKYKVKLVSYEEEYDWEVAAKMLNNDVANGDKLDMVIADASVLQSLINKGSFVDLNEYIDADKEINRADYFDNILRNEEINGKLYALSSSFSVTSMGVNAKYFKNDFITMDEVIELKKQYPDKSLMTYMSSNLLVTYFMYFNQGEFIDYNNATCSFDSDEFKKLLEFANTFPKEVDYNEGISEFKEIQDENCILIPMSISEMEELQVYDKLMNGNLKITGFPSSTGKGTVSSMENGVSILKKSKNKDACYEFVRTLLLDEMQDSIEYNGFPLSRRYFDSFMEKKKTDGGSFGWSDGTVEVSGDGITDKEINIVKAMIDKCNSAFRYDEEINNIVTEETAAFFAGSKSAEEVCEVMQSRVSLYLKEVN